MLPTSTGASRDSVTAEAGGGKRPPADAVPLEDLLKRLGASRDGLSQEEAERRLQRYGYNEIVEKEVHPLLKLLSYFWGPIPWMIEAAAVLSALVRHWEDFAIITALLVMNAGVGFWEEFQAGNAIAALKARLAPKARVRRDGAWKTIPAREVVPGDLVRIRIGEVVPADARLLAGDPIQVDQSALTGESLPVERGEGQTVYSSSIVKRGEIEALVTATGAETYFGRTARLVEQAHVVSHFQRAVLKIGDYLIVIAIALVILILGVALFRGDPMLTTLEFALVLTVAAVPVAMPAVLSITMAVGARLLARKEAIVSRLASIEELAGIDVLCSDKTGTLTENRLTLGDPFCLPGVRPEEVVQAGALASRREDEDPIDLAVLSGLKAGGTGAEVTHFQPFDPVSKRTEAVVRQADGRPFRVSKGAPQVILELVGATDAVRSAVDEAVEGFAARGFRSLGVARSEEGGGWRYLGVLPLHDPPRQDSRSTIETAGRMGVTVKMVTGDQVAIAREIAREVGMRPNIVDAGLFDETKHHEAGPLAGAIEKADGFAQVFPEHKFHIVDVLQHRGHIVGMTGDGVNDAPALKQADAGIAVSGATDAARAAADIVLLAPGLSVIVDAIKESRKIFQRMNSYATYRIAETIRVLLFMTLSILVFNFYPVTAVMIVLLALLNDGAILSIAYDRVHYSNAPERWNMREVLGIATILGLAGVVASFGLFYIAERVLDLDRGTIQSLIYLKLSAAGQMTIFLTRTRKAFWSIPPAPILLGAVVVNQTIATLIAVYGILMPPLGWRLALLVWGYAIAWFLVNDRIKLAAHRLLDPNRSGLFGERARRSAAGTRG
jgi:H+-transporting ATPase